MNPEDPIPTHKMTNLRHLFTWLFGNGRLESKVIEESRDITGKLTTVLKDAEATQYLIDHKDLSEAYERSGGETQLLIKSLKKSKLFLSKSLSLATGNFNEEAELILADCEKTIESIRKITE